MTAGEDNARNSQSRSIINRQLWLRLLSSCQQTKTLNISLIPTSSWTIPEPWAPSALMKRHNKNYVIIRQDEHQQHQLFYETAKTANLGREEKNQREKSLAEGSKEAKEKGWKMEIFRNSVNLKCLNVGLFSSLCYAGQTFYSSDKLETTWEMSCSLRGSGGEKDKGVRVAREGVWALQRPRNSCRLCADTYRARSEWRKAWRVSFDMSVA